MLLLTLLTEWLLVWLQASEEKLNLAQEELAANQTHQTGLEAQIQELQTGRGSLEQQLAKRDQRLQQQEQTLKELQKQQVRQNGLTHKDINTYMTWSD